MKRRSKHKHYLDELDMWASHYIRGKVKQMIRFHGFRSCDKEDLHHEFAANLLRRKPGFDPGVATWEAFVIVVCENYRLNLIRQRRAAIRTERCEDGSLDTPVIVEDRVLSFGDTIPDSQRLVHTGYSPRTTQEFLELRHDVAAVLAALPPQLRRLCELLQQGTVLDAARVLGMHRADVYPLIRVLREHFTAAGLRNYL